MRTFGKRNPQEDAMMRFDARMLLVVLMLSLKLLPSLPLFGSGCCCCS
jgi:hypothetical protein